MTVLEANMQTADEFGPDYNFTGQEPYTFTEFEQHIYELEGRIITYCEENGISTPKYIIGILNGGAEPTKALGSLMQIHTAYMYASHYKGTVRTEKVNISEHPSLRVIEEDDEEGFTVLLLDEMYDTGRTMADTKAYLEDKFGGKISNLVTATIHDKPSNHDDNAEGPNIFIEETNKWQVYWWERNHFLALCSHLQIEPDLPPEE